MPRLEPAPGEDLHRRWKASPAHNVFAVFESQSQAEAAARRLQNGGVSEESIRILIGDAGIEELDPTGQLHGLQGRVARALQQFGGEIALLESYAEHVRAGKAAMTVGFHDKEDRLSIEAILIDSGGAHMSYISDMTITAIVDRGHPA